MKTLRNCLETLAAGCGIVPKRSVFILQPMNRDAPRTVMTTWRKTAAWLARVSIAIAILAAIGLLSDPGRMFGTKASQQTTPPQLAFATARPA